MALRTITYTTPMPQWVDAYNLLAADAGDLTSLTTTAKSSLIAAINEHDAEIGVITTVNAGIVGATLVASINNFYTAYSAFVTSTNNSLATINTNIGTLGSLNDAIEGVSLVVTINNFYTAYLANKSTTDATLSSHTSSISTLTTSIGTLASLTTTDKTSLVNAANEIRASLVSLDTRVGALATINDAIEGASVVVSLNNFYTAYSSNKTTTDSSITTANSNISALQTLTGALTSINALIRGASLAVSIENEYNRVGALASLDNALTKTSIVTGINSLYTLYNNNKTTTDSSITTINSTLTEYNTRMGALADLPATVKTAINSAVDGGSLVEAISYVYNLVGGATAEFTNATISGNLTVTGTSSLGGAVTISAGNFTSRGISDTATANRLAVTQSLITLKTAVTMDTTLAVTGATTLAALSATSAALTGQLSIVATAPEYRWNESDAVLNAKQWREYTDGGVYRFAISNDAVSVTNDVFTITRSTHTAATFNFGSITTVQINGNTVWHAGNDGAGTGLDSDLLDGQHGSYYADIAARLGYTPLNAATYTAADVLAKLLTVDGAASGLDADLLDGQSSAYYTDIVSRLGYTPLNSTSYTAADVLAKLLTVDGVGSGIDADLLDGQSSAYYTDIVSRLGYTPLNSTSYTASDVLTKIKTVDGTGSGLDADTLDGLNSTAFALVTGGAFTGDITVYRSATPTTGYIFLNQAGTRWVGYDGTNYVFQGTQLYVNGSLVWHAGNDGSGSGLDGDTLRGTTPTTHGLALLASASAAATKTTLSLDLVENKTSATIRGELTSGNVTTALGYTPLNSATYTAADVLAKLLTVDGAASALDADLLDAQQGTYYLARANHTGTQAWSTLTGTPTTLAGYGIGDAVSTATYTAADVLAKLLTVDGPSSGLDADTLDGYQATNLMILANQGQRLTTLAGADVTGGTAPSSSASSALEIFQATAGADAYITFHVSSDYAAHFGLDGGTNDLFFGGWSSGATTANRIWHAGNDGSGSGLDADLLRGVTPSAFALTILDDADASAVRTTIGALASSSYTAADVLSKLLTVDGTGSGLDADLLDGLSSAAFGQLSATQTWSGTNTFGVVNTGALSTTTITASGAITSTGDITAFSSDMRLKNFDGKVKKAMDIIDKLSGYFFYWNEAAAARSEVDTHKRRVGVMAQEVEAVLPEAMGAEIDGYKTVRYDAIIPVLIEAIKELREELRLARLG